MVQYQTLIFDIETNGLLDTLDRLHTLCIREYETGESWTFRHNDKENTIKDGLYMLSNCNTLVGHNIYQFDLPAIEKVYPWFETDALIRDTLVITRHIFSDIKNADYRLWERGKLLGKYIGIHTLDAWGYRVGLHKGDYAKQRETEAKEQGLTGDDITHYVWGVWNQDMEDYCVNDVDVTAKLWTRILKENYPEEPIRFEHMIHALACKMEENGFPFDIKRANKLADALSSEVDELSSKAIEHYGKWYAPEKKRVTGPLWEGQKADKVYPKPRPQYGEDNSRKVWAEITIPKRTTVPKSLWRKSGKSEQLVPNPCTTAGAPYCKVKLKEFNPGSRQMIIDRFTTIYDWEPNAFTDKGNPEVNDDVLTGLSDVIPMAKELAQIFYLNKRLGQVLTGPTAWLKMVEADGAIHCRTNTGGTVSGRCSHSKPNIAQVPSVKSAPVLIPSPDDTEIKVLNPKILNAKGEPFSYCYDAEGELKKKVMLRGQIGNHGFDCRRLFYVPKDWILVGTDLSGIELRCLANLAYPYDNGFLVREILEGDIHTANQNAAGLSTRDQAKTFIYACCTLDTQALTTTGWKTYDELEVGELILTYNQKDNVTEWKPVLEKVFYEDAEVIEMSQSSGFSFKCTPNHRWFVKQRRRKGDYRRPYFTDEVLMTTELTTESNIIVNAPHRENRIHAEYLPEINKMVKRETDWVKEVLSMSMGEVKAFLSGFLIADGYYQTKSVGSGSWNWNQNTGTLSEAALVASLLGNNGYVRTNSRNDTPNPMTVCHLNSKQHVTTQTMKFKDLPNQPVWCVRTENESWVARQGKVITVTGNTIYGAGDEKVGSIVDSLASPEKQRQIGKRLKAQFFRKLPGLAAAVKQIQRECRRGYIIGLDGRRLSVRAKHSALNLRLQSDGAVIAKKWALTAEEKFLDMGLEHGWTGDFAFLAFVHDELQVAVRAELAEAAQKIMIDAAREAGEFYNFNIPVDAESKVGINWAETH